MVWNKTCFHYSGQTVVNSANPSHISAPMLNAGPVISVPTQGQSGLGSCIPSVQMPVFNQNQGHIVSMNSMMPNKISMQGQIILPFFKHSIHIYIFDIY